MNTDTGLCICGCGRPVQGRSKYATQNCRKRVSWRKTHRGEPKQKRVFSRTESTSHVETSKHYVSKIKARVDPATHKYLGAK